MDDAGAETARCVEVGIVSMYTCQFVISDADTGIRLDAAVHAQCPASTRALIRRAIAAGGVTVNGRAVDKGDKLDAGDAVAVRCLPETGEARVRADAAVALDVLYEDAALIAVNKPAGLACQPLDADETGTIANGLVARYPELLAVGDTPLAAGVLHRLDGGTSGVVLAARTPEVYAAMRRQFRDREIIKRYVALVEGSVTEPGRLTHDLAHQPAFRGRMVEARTVAQPDRVMRAVTEYRPVRRIGSQTMLEVTIRTGVTHQIRCQLTLIGHPVVGDVRYGAAAVAGFNRHFLHAQAICFRHPLMGDRREITAPLTADLLAIM
jgi:23S rRNA pseudouridine1911/1915/1917 synthase